MESTRASAIFDSRWSRRQFLRRAGLGGATLMSAGAIAEFLAACGSSTTAATGNVKVGWTNVVIPENLIPTNLLFVQCTNRIRPLLLSSCRLR